MSETFESGQRFVVTESQSQYEDMDGCYGHVVAASPQIQWIQVFVEGRTGKGWVDPEVSDCNPWPYYRDELEHAD